MYSLIEKCPSVTLLQIARHGLVEMMKRLGANCTVKF
jgi:hypothetical protein